MNDSHSVRSTWHSSVDRTASSSDDRSMTSGASNGSWPSRSRRHECSCLTLPNRRRIGYESSRLDAPITNCTLPKCSSEPVASYFRSRGRTAIRKNSHWSSSTGSYDRDGSPPVPTRSGRTKSQMHSSETRYRNWASRRRDLRTIGFGPVFSRFSSRPSAVPALGSSLRPRPGSRREETLR